MNRFNLVIEFLNDNPKYISGKNDLKDTQKLKEKFFSDREREVNLALPNTISDCAVSAILKASNNYDDHTIKFIDETHKYSMAAENLVGHFLERYLAQKAEKVGWVWCSGNFVRAIDFIKKDDDGLWIALQIKNRDNTENSSSSAIRNGKNIQKWFRSYSKPSFRRTTNTNWENFPDKNLVSTLSENDFLKFIENEIKNPK